MEKHRFFVMPQTREQKKKIVEEIRDKFKKQKIAFFVDFKGLKTRDLSDLKRSLKKAQSELVVAKKTLLGLALKGGELNFDVKRLEGQIAVVFGFKDEILPAKIVYQFSQKNEKLKVLGGIFDGNIIEKEKIIELAQLPSKEELLAGLVGRISSPIYGLVNVLQGNIKGLITILAKAKAEKA